MYRVLVCGLANEKDQGGIETMVLNYYQRFNRKKYTLILYVTVINIKWHIQRFLNHGEVEFFILLKEVHIHLNIIKKWMNYLKRFHS